MKPIKRILLLLITNITIKRNITASFDTAPDNIKRYDNLSDSLTVIVVESVTRV